MPNQPFVQTVSSLVQGISRQAPGVRYPGQVADAKNITFNVVDGARKRHGTIFKSREDTGGEPYTNYAMHRIERDEDEEYLIVYGEGFFKIYDTIENEWITPTYADTSAQTYLAYGSPNSKQLRFVTIADTTFIANTKRTMSTGTNGDTITASRMPVKMVRTSTAPTAFEISTAEWKERSFHQQYLEFDSEPTEGTFRLGYLGDSTSKEYRSDTGSGTTMTLPFNAESDDISKYLNGNGVKQDDATDKHEAITGLGTIAYGKVIVTGGPIHKKKIKITFSPDLDVDEMVTIHANSCGTLNKRRGHDDIDPAPLPMRENMKVSGLAYHRNRLCFTADEICVFSATDDVFQFFQETPGTLVDSDPIVAQLAATDVCIIDSVAPFRNALILLTKAGQQFELGSGDVFSPSTAAVTPSTRYQTQSVPPVQIGDRMYMVGVGGSYSTLLEYFYDDQAVSNKAADITKHVDDLLPPVVIQIEAAPTQETVLIMPTLEGDTTGATIYSSGSCSGGCNWSSSSSWAGGVAPTIIDNATIVGSDVITFDSYPGDPTPLTVGTGAAISGKLFVYRAYSTGQERKQSAWTVWDFGNDALQDMKVIDDTLYVLRRQTDATNSKNYVHIETIDMSESPAGLVGPTGSTWNPHLDHRTDQISGSYSVPNTTWTLPVPDIHANTAVLTDGTVLTVTPSTNGDTVSVTGDHTSYPAYIGRKVVSSMTLSTLYARDQQGKPLLDGRTKSKKLVLNHEQAGTYTVSVANSQDDVRDRTTTHTPDNPLGVSSSGELIAWTHGKNTETTITIESNTPQPVTWIAMENHGEIDRTTEGKQ